jgi:hypothetical protein
MPVALRRLRQKDLEFNASLNYLGRPCHTKQNRCSGSHLQPKLLRMWTPGGLRFEASLDKNLVRPPPNLLLHK